ncbi:hypothetical protein TUMEXPCC7403_19350 [Tumidithrix helvetica PCC 7403]|uniref:hypothetical protein n=1 Tax=Tumidithrix helvetica TaxID=3457545 RepID=UPI003CA97BB7
MRFIVAIPALRLNNLNVAILTELLLICSTGILPARTGSPYTQKNCDARVSSSEVAELNLYEQLDALMTMLKVRAHVAQNHQGTSSVPNPA